MKDSFTHKVMFQILCFTLPMFETDEFTKGVIHWISSERFTLWRLRKLVGFQVRESSFEYLISRPNGATRESRVRVSDDSGTHLPSRLRRV
jgi:hypothetical protein